MLSLIVRRTQSVYNSCFIFSIRSRHGPLAATFRYRLLLGLVLFATTKIPMPPRLLLVLYEGEGGSTGKVEGILDLLQNEEKGENSTTSATSNVRSYHSTLAFLFSPPCHDKSLGLHPIVLLFRFFNFFIFIFCRLLLVFKN